MNDLDPALWGPEPTRWQMWKAKVKGWWWRLRYE